MPDKLTDVTDNKVGKMTDSEIVKALEKLYSTSICATEFQVINVEGLRKFGFFIKAVIDLINRLQAEKSNLEIELQAMRGAANSYKAENERLKEEIELLHSDYTYKFVKAKAKAEARKEFAERLKESFANLEYKAKTQRKTVKIEELKNQVDWVLHIVVIETVDNLYKELVGDK